jgi:hypothetical protein
MKRDCHAHAYQRTLIAPIDGVRHTGAERDDHSTTQDTGGDHPRAPTDKLDGSDRTKQGTLPLSPLVRRPLRWNIKGRVSRLEKQIPFESIRVHPLKPSSLVGL